MQTIVLQRTDGPLVVDLYQPPADHEPLPVLLVHGWGGSGRYWSSLIARLDQRYRFIVPDLPGVGRSLPVRRAYSMADQVAAIEALLDHLQLRRVQLVGHSMGGALGMLLAAKRPELIERLVLTSICLFRNERERRSFVLITRMLALSMRLRAPWMADVALLRQSSARRYFYRVPQDEAILRAGFLDYLLMDRATAVASAHSAASPAIPAAAARVQCPTLLIAPREDQVMPVANVEYTGRVIPGCTIRWIEQCGHLPMVEQPDQYAALVDGFLCSAQAQRRALPDEPVAAYSRG